MINECTKYIVINRPARSEMTIHINVHTGISLSNFRFPLLTYSIRVIRLVNKPSQLIVLVISKKETPRMSEKISKNRIRIVKASSCFIRIFLEFKKFPMKTFFTKLSTRVCKFRLLNLQPVNFTVGFSQEVFLNISSISEK